MITLLWAQTNEGVIGQNEKLPWNIKEEMQHFIKYTKNKTVLMGRKTWDSLYVKPLPNRQNIVITNQNLVFDHKDIKFTNKLENVLKDFKNSQEELIIIGGKQIFELTLEYANKLVVSYIKEDYKGDVYAPFVDLNLWKVTQTSEFDEFIVRIYERY
ncbi:dihydrofolate reductase [Spiroplasma culicicola]|uniref:dihydrofolate reductase n=1 Tax=Spiroplasma culicicola AES-1 TaxID=1276246 RepID=W6AHD6_9MOLU|nr:dihydrofolate reductase [Spiroplasma culicicola]AHI53099.1 dihydrofolate reductase [Spiroplasma culicicola AES-1]